MEALGGFLREYKKISIDIIEALDIENIDLLAELFNSRQLVIDKINKMKYTSKEFSDLCSDLGILFLEERIKIKIEESKNEILSERKKLSDSKTANKSYTKTYVVDSIYFNKMT